MFRYRVFSNSSEVGPFCISKPLIALTMRAFQNFGLVGARIVKVLELPAILGVVALKEGDWASFVLFFMGVIGFQWGGTECVRILRLDGGVI